MATLREHTPKNGIPGRRPSGFSGDPARQNSGLNEIEKLRLEREQRFQARAQKRLERLQKRPGFMAKVRRTLAAAAIFGSGVGGYTALDSRGGNYDPYPTIKIPGAKQPHREVRISSTSEDGGFNSIGAIVTAVSDKNPNINKEALSDMLQKENVELQVSKGLDPDGIDPSIVHSGDTFRLPPNAKGVGEMKPAEQG